MDFANEYGRGHVWQKMAVQPYCWPCCCACLPLLGLLKGLLICVPCALASSLACFVISVIVLPHDVWYTYYTFATTPRLGPTIKFFFLLLLAIPLICWPPVVLTGIFIGTLVYSLGGPVWATFTDEDSSVLTSGVAKTVNECVVKLPRSFWEFNTHSYFSYLQAYREPLHANEKPFDVPLYWIPFGLFLILLGELVALPTAIVLVLVKFVPGLVYWYYKAIETYVRHLPLSSQILGFPLFLLALALLPVVVTAGAILFILLAIFMGITPPGAAYNRGPMAGFRRVVNNIGELDKLSNLAAFRSKKHSCLGLCYEGEDDLFG